MPSSPPPAEYQRQPERFFNRGTQLLPQDALSENKWSYQLNMRSYMEGTQTPREGWSPISVDAMPNPIVSLFRVNDSTPTASINAARFAMSGDELYADPALTGVFNLVGGGFSGNPVTGVVSTPYASPRPYLYIGDSAQQRKVNTNIQYFPIGIASPPNEPTAIYSSVQKTFFNNVAGGDWVGYGGAASNPGASTLRINTTITALLFDEGAQPSMASVALADMVGVVPGITIILNGTTEPVVEEVHPAIAQTTIAAIIYDTAPNGLCTIQPDNSLSAGQIEQALPKDVQQRYTAKGEQPPRVSVSRTVDYPVDSLILVDGVEVVRILSVAIGQDGTLSFRCFTNGSFAAGATLTGIASFRAYVNGAVNIGDPATADQLTNVITPPTSDPLVGGIQAPAPGSLRNWGLVGARTTQPDDYIRFGIKVGSYEHVESVRVLLNMSDDTGTGAADFLHNYYFYEWRKNDLLEAIQVSVGAATALVTDRQREAIQQGQVAGFYQDQYGMNETSVAVNWEESGGPNAPTTVPVRTTPGGSPTSKAGRADNTVTVGSAISRQLSVGNEQWVVLQCRVGDLTRVGSDETLSINVLNAAAITVQLGEDADDGGPLTVSYSDLYILGGYGPDVSVTWNPYVYRYRYRSTLTGEKSNFSPPMRAGVKPHRGQIVLTAAASTSDQVDVIDWFRLGGALARWAYTGTCDNATPTYADDMADRQISNGPTVDFEQYQPWPVSDQPRSGTCSLAGTAVQRTTGDAFNTLWAEGSAIIVNGRATSLYKQPSTGDLLHVVDNCGSGDNIPYSLPEPTILSQPLSSLWGGPINDVLFHFACGDPNDPGVLHWTQGNDPDATTDRNTLIVTSTSEPLVNGCFYNGVPFVFSSDKLYRIRPTGSATSPFIAEETGCEQGLWCAWAMAVTDYGIVFLGKDGVYITQGGPATPLTDPDWRPLFPQDGSTESPQPMRGTVPNAQAPRTPIEPPDYASPTQLQFCAIDSLVYFDYLSTEGNYQTLVFDVRATGQGWGMDLSLLTGVGTRLLEPGEAVHSALIGGRNGHVYRMDASKTTDVDTPIPWEIDTRFAFGGDPRPMKQWGDAILDFNPCNSFGGITVIPQVRNGLDELTPRILGAGINVRTTFIVEVGVGVGGEGVWSRNFGLRILGSLDPCDDQRPILYLWEPAWRAKGSVIARRATDWEDLGYPGAKFVQGVVIRANTFGLDKTVEVQFDGPNLTPQTALTLTLNHNGEQTKAYPLAAAGWDPFTAELVRLKGADDVDWTLESWRFVWEPAPELATQWETQYTTHDLPGFVAVYDGVMAYIATADITLSVEYQDGASGVYVLPHNSGAYRRYRQILQAQKGKAVRYRWTSPEPFRLVKPDCSVRIQGWGIGGGYAVVSPFGGPSRADGAGV